MSNTAIFVWAAVILVVFGFLWSKGHLTRFSRFVGETKTELRKCAWPNKAELKGSTAVVLVSVVLLAGFTVLVDFVFRILLSGAMKL